jgi:hypothetical protein
MQAWVVRARACLQTCVTARASFSLSLSSADHPRIAAHAFSFDLGNNPFLAPPSYSIGGDCEPGTPFMAPYGPAGRACATSPATSQAPSRAASPRRSQSSDGEGSGLQKHVNLDLADPLLARRVAVAEALVRVRGPRPHLIVHSYTHCRKCCP